MESVTQQLRTRELAKIDSLQRYGYRVFTEILTPAQVQQGGPHFTTYSAGHAVRPL